MEVLAFDLRSSLGQFRRPDTTVTHATYPFITRTVLSGLLGSILGLRVLDGENWLGLQLLSPVRTITQQMSMLGKGWVSGGNLQFNRPTAIELVVNPHYRVYYSGHHLAELIEFIQAGRACYHTYLGSAFCLAFPKSVATMEGEELSPETGEAIETVTVVPSHAISRLIPRPGATYGRVGGMHYQYLGNREFAGTVNVIYERRGGRLAFEAASPTEWQGPPCRFLRLPQSGGIVICLW
ncbi:MAG: CRISPR-associated protein Cas5 [Bacillota bacterium]|nr:CRISPR-associated protein Cas5 [Bacillota bacterium]